MLNENRVKIILSSTKSHIWNCFYLPRISHFPCFWKVVALPPLLPPPSLPRHTQTQRKEFSFFFFNPHQSICLLILERDGGGDRERDREREREGETISCLLCVCQLGINLQPRYVPWPGTEPTTWIDAPINWATQPGRERKHSKHSVQKR